MAIFLLALVACALIFGSLLHVAELSLASLDGRGIDAVDSALRTLAMVATVAVPLLWSLRVGRAAGAFLFGFTAAALVTGPLFAGLALAGRLPHL